MTGRCIKTLEDVEVVLIGNTIHNGRIYSGMVINVVMVK